MEIINTRAGGVEKFFVDIYNSESDAVFRFCILRTSDREVAIDLTQDTFMRFWKYLSVEKEVKNYRALLFTIARNIIIDWYRKKKAFSLEALVDNTEDNRPSLTLVAPDNVETIAEAEFMIRKIGELPELYATSVYLRCVEELKPREIAQILGEPPNVISVRISRGLEQLRGLLHIANVRTNS